MPHATACGLSWPFWILQKQWFKKKSLWVSSVFLQLNKQWPKVKTFNNQMYLALFEQSRNLSVKKKQKKETAGCEWRNLFICAAKLTWLLIMVACHGSCFLVLWMMGHSSNNTSDMMPQHQQQRCMPQQHHTMQRQQQACCTVASTPCCRKKAQQQRCNTATTTTWSHSNNNNNVANAATTATTTTWQQLQQKCSSNNNNNAKTPTIMPWQHWGCGNNDTMATTMLQKQQEQNNSNDADNNSKKQKQKQKQLPQKQKRPAQQCWSIWYCCDAVATIIMQCSGNNDDKN